MGCKSVQIKTTVLAVIAVMCLSAVVPVLADGSDASSPVTVTDGKGTTFTFDTVPEHIITVGKGVTATAIEIGVLDKVVVCDSYSYKASESIFDSLKEKVDAGDISADGNIYSSGKAALITDIIDAADTAKGGVFDKTSDAVFITGSDTYTTPIVSSLRDDYGFTKVLVWNDTTVSQYSVITDFVKVVSLVSKGSVDGSVRIMQDLPSLVSSLTAGKEKREAFYVTYSYSVFKVGNTGSMANALITAAGGDVVTVDPSQSASTYETNLTELVANHPKAVIFVDSSLYANQANYEKLKTQIGSAVSNVVPMQSIWNNYCVESMDGVVTMAFAMYSTTPGEQPQSSVTDNTPLYAGVAVAAVAIIAAAGAVFLRRH